MANNTFLFKPISEGKNRGNASILLPSSLTGQVKTVSIQTANGEIIPINFDKVYEDGRGIYRTSKPGRAYGAGAKVIATLDNGQNASWDLANPGSRIEANYKEGTYGEQTGGYQSSTATSPGGTEYVQPGVSDQWANLPTPYVDYQTALADAQALGKENKESYFGNLNDPRTKSTALGLVQTDVEGIQNSVNALAPMARQQGQLDQDTNISRANQLDQNNLARIPGFNTFNRKQAEEANAFNQSQQAKAVEATGLGYKKRMTTLLDQLSTQATGKLASPMEEQLTASARNRATDMTNASGISGISGAGIRAQDRLNILERMQLMQNAQASIPGVLQNAQSTLYSAPERAPTLYGQPTAVPLQASNIEARMPIQSSISAGNAQLGIGTQATNYEIIPAVTSLEASLNTEKYNQTGAYTTALQQANADQGYISGTDKALQNAMNNDADVASANKAIQAKRDSQIMESAMPFITSMATDAYDWLTGTKSSAGGGGGGTSSGGIFTTGGESASGQPVMTGVDSQGNQTYGGYNSGNSSLNIPQTQAVGSTNVGGSASSANSGGSGDYVASAPGQSIDDIMQRKMGLGGNYNTGIANVVSSIVDKVSNSGLFSQDSNVKAFSASGTQGAQITKQDFATSMPTAFSKAYPESSTPSHYEQFANDVKGFFEGTDVLGQPNYPTPKEDTIMSKLTSALPDNRQDAKTLFDVGSTIMNWSNKSPSQQVASAGNTGANIAVDKGLVSKEEGYQIAKVSDALATVMNPNASEVQKSIAIANATAGVTTTQFTGSPQQPKTISGNPVVGSTTTKDGNEAFMVKQPDGSIANVPKSELVTSSSVASGLSAVSVLTSKASDEQKLAALTGIGINTAQANYIISQVNAGNANAALSLFNTATNWDDMNTFQKTISTVQTTQSVMQTISRMMPNMSSSVSSALPSGAGGALQTAGQLAGQAAGLYGIYSGTKDAVTMIQHLNNEAKSTAVMHGVKQGAMAGAKVGAGVGAFVPIPGASVIFAAIGAQIGAGVGAVTGMTGTGKNAAQLQRDQWRTSMQQNNMLDKNYQTTLADGTKFDMGKDGNNKLKNSDGSERRYKDIDWNNKLAPSSVPMGHLMAMANGLDPTNSSKLGNFDNMVSYSVNAATSNAKSFDDVKANYKSMMGDIKPQDLALKTELARASGTISDQEYSVYLNTINDMYGTNFVQDSRDNFVNGLNELYKGQKLDKNTTKFLEQFNDPKVYAKNLKRMQERTASA